MYIVGLGSNLGARFATLAQAAARLDRSAGCRVVARSRVYESEPLGPPQPLYLNAALLVESGLLPDAMLSALLAIEVQLGRVRPSDGSRWGPRILDLDLLWGPRPYSSPSLVLPHPGLMQRWFALAPLLDVTRGVGELVELTTTSAAQLEALGGVPRDVRSASFGNEAERMFDADPFV